MKKNNEIMVYSIVGNSFCVASEDGEKVLDVIKKNIDENINVIISFKNVEMLTSAFLNTAIGRLYGVYADETLKSLLSVKDISIEDKMLLKRVIDTAKAFYKDKERVISIENDVIEGVL